MKLRTPAFDRCALPPTAAIGLRSTQAWYRHLQNLSLQHFGNGNARDVLLDLIREKSGYTGNMWLYAPSLSYVLVCVL